MKYLAVIVPSILFVLVALFLSVQKVECYTQFGICSDDLLSKAQLLKNTKILFPLPLTKAKQIFSSSFIKEVQLHRRLPSTLIVSLSLSRPVGILSSNVLGAAIVIDDNGNVIGPASGSALPILYVDGQESLSNGSHIQYLPALESLNILGSVVSAPISATVNQKVLKVKLPHDTEVLVDLDKSPQSWYTALQVIWERSKIDGRKPKKIDLRFSRPVLTY